MGLFVTKSEPEPIPVVSLPYKKITLAGFKAVQKPEKGIKGILNPGS